MPPPPQQIISTTHSHKPQKYRTSAAEGLDGISIAILEAPGVDRRA